MARIHIPRPSPIRAIRPLAGLAALGLLLAAGTHPATAQNTIGQTVPGKAYTFYDFDAGGDEQAHVKAYFWGAQEEKRVLCVTPPGLASSIYFEPASGDSSWAEWFADRGWSFFALDLPGCGESVPPKNPDIVNMTNKAVELTYHSVMASFPRVIYAQGVAAAFVIKLRNTTPEAASGAILLDPVGPKGIQPEISARPEDIAQRRAHLRDHLWREWGIGPEPGKSYPHSDLGEEGFERLMEEYDQDAQPYWAAALTGLQTWLQIATPRNIPGWAVLVVRGPHPTEEMDQRREAVVQWLLDNGAQVEEMDLATEAPQGLSNLPMAGTLAPQVASLLLEWIENVPPNERFPSRSTKP